MADTTATPVAPELQFQQSSAPQLSSEQAPSNAATTTTPPDASAYTSGSNGAVTGSSTTAAAYGIDVLCGPLLNYRRMSNELSNNPTWHGSVLIVAKPGSEQPTLRLGCIGAVHGVAQSQPLPSERSFPGERLYEDPGKAFWRFMIDVPVLDFEANWQYLLVQSSSTHPKVFIVPAKTQSMRMMFHSCNGFSVGTDEDAWSGPALWSDVLRVHKEKPFHVMIGGGDQIYNDNVRVIGPLKEWTDIKNPIKRRDYQFNEDLRQRCDDHYYNNYIRWYGTEPFKSANCVIPQINIWDDHDIIDGFGSYTDRFMRCHVFRGIGGVAHK
jgi:PhoD related phosphatase